MSAKASMCGEWQDTDADELFVSPTVGDLLRFAVAEDGKVSAVHLTLEQAKSVAAVILAWTGSEAPKRRAKR